MRHAVNRAASGRAVVALVAALGAAVVALGCDPGTASRAPGQGSGAPGSAASNGTEATDPGLTVGPPPSPTPDEATPAVLDPSLLDYLPETIGGVEVTEAPDEAALALADPGINEIATALDVGLVVDQASGNLVTAHVVRLREGAFGDETFRQWRNSFDDGACARAGGVVGRLEVPLAERNVHVTSCAGELRTYHVWIADEDLLISAASVGEGRFGELLMTALRIE